jgi:hypothetical protein
MPALGSLAERILPGFLERPLRDAVIARRDAAALRAYRAHPVPPPPHAVKVEAVLGAASRSGARVLVETGTFEGEMARKCRRAFRSILTIELSDTLARAAARRLAPYPNIRVVQGDSAVRLPELLRQIREPALFWLDGHYSGEGTARGCRDTPLEEELRAITRHEVRGHGILIDDARLLGTGDYPTRERILALLCEACPNAEARIEDDILICERLGR